MLITVFTPTYNRANTITRTFKSLKKQSFRDFEWLIIDDGSTDDSEAVISTLIDKSDFAIRYIKKENGGKHTAYNLALDEAKGDLFFTVDSDDWLPEDSLERIASRFHAIENEKTLAGIIGLKENQHEKLIGTAFKHNGFIATLRELELSGQQGERSIIFKTQIAREYRFPVIDGERFMTEGVAYDRFYKYSFLILNEVFTTCEYQEDGLSSNPKTLMIRNPGGYMLYYRNRIDMAVSMKERIGYVLRYNVFKHLISGKCPESYRGPHSILVRALSIVNPLTTYYYKHSQE